MNDIFLFGNIPQNVIGIIGPCVIIAVGFLAERNVVGRAPTLANAAAMNLAFYGKSFSSLGVLQVPLVLYLDIGLVIGLGAIVALAEKKQFPKEFYAISWAYSSIVAGGVTLLSTLVPYLG